MDLQEIADVVKQELPERYCVFSCWVQEEGKFVHFECLKDYFQLYKDRQPELLFRIPAPPK